MSLTVVPQTNVGDGRRRRHRLVVGRSIVRVGTVFVVDNNSVGRDRDRHQHDGGRVRQERSHGGGQRSSPYNHRSVEMRRVTYTPSRVIYL